MTITDLDPGRRRSSLGALALGAFAIGTDTFVVVGVLPDVASDLRVRIGDAGWVSMVFAVVYAVAAPVLGAATGSLDRRKLLVLSMVGFAVGNTMSATAPGLGTLLGARVVTAAFGALFVPAASATAAAQAEPNHRGRAMSVVLGGLSVSHVMGVPIGTWLSGNLGWRATFWALSGLGLVCAAVVASWLPAIPLPPPPGLAARLAPLRDPRVATAVFITTLFMTGVYVARTYIGAVLEPVTGGNGTVLAWLLLGYGTAGIIGTSLSGWATDKWGATIVLVSSLVVLALVLVSLPVAREHVTRAALVLAIWGLAAMAAQPPQQHRMLEFAPEAGVLALSLFSAATFVGVGLGGLLGRAILVSAGTPDEGLNWLGPVGAALVITSIAVTFATADNEQITG